MSVIRMIEGALLLMVVSVIRSVIGNEARAWLPYAARFLVDAAVGHLPSGDRERYRREWHAEIAAYGDRPLTALVRAFGLRRAARGMSAASPVARVALRDRVVGVALFVAIAPLLLLIVVAIRLESPGPTMSRARVRTPDGRRVFCLRFRTFHVAPRDSYRVDSLRSVRARALGLELPLALDAPTPLVAGVRLTRVGRVLRRHSLHHLPVVVSIARGDVRLTKLRQR